MRLRVPTSLDAGPLPASLQNLVRETPHAREVGAVLCIVNAPIAIASPERLNTAIRVLAAVIAAHILQRPSTNRVEWFANSR